jgi:hypothetical protein
MPRSSLAAGSQRRGWWAATRLSRTSRTRRTLAGHERFRSECAAPVAFTGRWTRVPSETAGVRFEVRGVRAAFAFSLRKAGGSQTAEPAPRGGRRCRGLR